MRRLSLIILFGWMLVTACKKDNTDTKPKSPYAYDWAAHVPFTTDYQTFSLPFTSDFGALPIENGTVALTETSGIAYSIKNPGKIWAHNDSGHPNNIFLIDASTGAIVATYVVLGSSNIDWEDMEIAINPKNGEPYLYIADTGDNDEKRPTYDIYRFPEPIYDSVAHFGKVTTLQNLALDRIRFKYPTGSHDTESMFVDAATGDVYLVTKRDAKSILFVAPFPQKINEIYPIYEVGRLSFRLASAATMSASGERILIKNRQEIFYWTRTLDVPIHECLATTPTKAPYVGEPQGEAICFDTNDNYYTLSEALNSQTKPTLYKYFKL